MGSLNYVVCQMCDLYGAEHLGLILSVISTIVQLSKSIILI